MTRKLIELARAGVTDFRGRTAGLARSANAAAAAEQRAALERRRAAARSGPRAMCKAAFAAEAGGQQAGEDESSLLHSTAPPEHGSTVAGRGLCPQWAPHRGGVPVSRPLLRYADRASFTEQKVSSGMGRARFRAGLRSCCCLVTESVSWKELPSGIGHARPRRAEKLAAKAAKVAARAAEAGITVPLSFLDGADADAVRCSGERAAARAAAVPALARTLESDVPASGRRLHQHTGRPD